VVVDDPAFAPADPSTPFSVHTRWIETEFVNTIAPYSGAASDDEAGAARETVTVEVGGKRLEVVLPAQLHHRAGSPVRRRRAAAAHTAGAHSREELTAPMQGTIVKVAVNDGDAVDVGDLIVVLEAMKMEQPLTAHRAGTIAGLAAQAGQTVAGGAVVCEIRD
jgi:acetyl-CoA/propionyl-CoA carboxylase biotin carboxyl carrier protein